VSKRFYFCAFLGDGTEQNPYRTKFQDMGVHGLKYLDMRAYPQIEDGYIVVWGDISDADHTTAIIDSSVTYLPFEDASGIVLSLSSTLSSIPAAKRSIITTAFTARGIPTAGITLSWTIAQALQLMRRRMMLRLLLSNLDFDDHMILISAMPPLRIKAVKRALTNHGFDVSGITGVMTVAEAIAVLSSQPALDSYIDRIPELVL
jgi:hypothetical protein